MNIPISPGWHSVLEKNPIKVIIHTHNIEYQRFRSLGKWWWPLLKRYEKWSFQKADGLFFITPEDKNFAITKWGLQQTNAGCPLWH
ncbi:MAG: hypothetical protein IPO53_15415 [Chitinophagaceae bacterium]|nr:hypothetical protein [Chitinophagaceae bacterium]